MSRADQLPTATADYRSSHLDKGGRYDAQLAASPFDAYMTAWEAKYVPDIVRRHFPSGVERYLDFACGTGRITELVAPLARSSTAVDISPTMIEEARMKCPTTTFHHCDLTSEDRDLGRFDLATSFRFFGNAQAGLREAVLAAIVKRLDSGGVLLINNHRNPNAIYMCMRKLAGGDDEGMDLTMGRLRDLLSRHGLSVVETKPIGAWLLRARLMQTVRPEEPRALRNEARFGSSLLTSVAPDVIVVARKH